MRRTRFGRQIYLLGENRVAARAAALPITLLTVGAFGIASLYTAGLRDPDRRDERERVAAAHRQLHVRRDRRRARRRQCRDRRARVDRADGRRRDLHRDDLGHAAPARLLDGRADPRPRHHRRRRRRPDEPPGAQSMSDEPETTRRRPRAGELAPFAILAVMIVALGAPARAHAVHGAHRERVRHLPELRLVRPRGARARHHDHRGRVRSLGLVDVPPRRHGRGADRRRLAARSASSPRSARRSSSASFRAA